ncbi:MAG: histidine kinase [Firmicutes bacterium]|nr:histidine kinase [Bacillota bacterium]
MNSRALRPDAVDALLHKTISILADCKGQMNDILQSTRTEYNYIQMQIQDLNNEIAIWIKNVDRLEREFRRSRQRLYQSSLNCDNLSEQFKKEIYEEADRIREALTIAREREKHLRKRREEQEKSLVRIEQIYRKSEKLVSQVGIAIDFLSGNLEDVNQQLEGMQARYQLGQKVIKVQEDERRRVAREIHDGPAQDLANVVLKAEICEKMFVQGRGKETMVELAELKDMIKESLNDVRRIIYNLRPMTLDDLGLIPTVKKFIDEFKSQTGIRAELTVLGKQKRLDQSVEVALFRTIQEALNNCKKHAEATRVSVKIEFLSNAINVVIDDNGKGFEPQIVRTKMIQNDHFGLLGMEERIVLLGGTWNLQSAPGQGTRIIARIPLDYVKEGL